jgi:hypothetical protein
MRHERKNARKTRFLKLSRDKNIRFWILDSQFKAFLKLRKYIPWITYHYLFIKRSEGGKFLKNRFFSPSAPTLTLKIS